MKCAGDFPAVFLSYDEPWADEFWEDLRGKAPKAVRVHGVRGLDASHKAAAKAANSDWFVTVDADTLVDPEFFSEPIAAHFLSPNFRLVWSSRSEVNGLVSGNGCLKLWSRRLIREMRTHEAAGPDELSLDHDIGRIRPGSSMSVTMPGCFSRTFPAMTPYHAFRCGFRESVFLGTLRHEAALSDGVVPAAGEALGLVQEVWGNLGRHAENGLWVIYGVRLGAWYLQNRPGWDPRRINDYDWFSQFWARLILPRFQPGGSRCRYTGVTWDHDLLAAEVEALGNLVRSRSIAFSEFTAPQSALVSVANGAIALRGGSSVDAIGWAFLKGRGTTAEPAIARDMFEIAAAMGLPAALNNLARMHDLGKIPDARPAEAERLYARAAATGNPHAPRHLARLLGRSPERANAEAERIAALFDLAAERGTALSVEPPPPPDLDFWPRPLTLGDLPWIRLGRDDARPSDADTSLTGPVVIVYSDVEPFESSRSISPDPVLLRAGQAIAYPARNAVTGQTGPWALCVCPDASRAGTIDPDAALVVPEYAGTWVPDSSPEGAFHSAFDLAMAGSAGDPEVLALMASLGADRPNGRWWMLGAGLGLLPDGGTAVAAWLNEASLLVAPERLADRIEHVARQVRLARGVPIRPLAPRESQAARRMSPNWPAFSVWLTFCNRCEALGPDGAHIASAYRDAAAWLWGRTDARRPPERLSAKALAGHPG